MEAEKIDNTKIIEKSLEDVMHSAMMPYSVHVNLERSIPRVEDGLKPVQRRILYSMYESGVTNDKPYKKSARIVGDCMGKYHPHGDSSIYDAMVRLAQPFQMSEMLVDGHGNFGSVDGDSAAAMRYTEVRLQGIAEEMLRDIDKDTVKWRFNFDDSCKEPETLPGRFPNLLVNGSAGIGVGLATNIPPHNITEVIDGVLAYIDKPTMKLDEMMNYIKGPDFPTGAYVLADDDMIRAYECGRGRIKIRSKAVIEKSGDKKSIIITEMPYNVNKANVLAKINELRETDEKFKNIAEVVDASDRTGMRAIIKIKREGNAAAILDLLFKHTALEISFNYNLVAIADNKPQQLGLMDIIKCYTEYQRSIIVRRSQFDLSAAKAREHILQGIIIAITNIDKVIKIIKTSPNVTECKVRLREAFGLSQIQAQAILDIRLARLTKLEVDKLKEEIEALHKLIAELTEIVGSKKKQFSVLKSELLEIRKKYKRPRRSVIVMNGVESSKLVEEFDLDKIEERKGYAVLTAGGTIKFLSAKSFNAATKTLDNAGINDICLQYIEADNLHPLYGFTDKGNCVVIDVNALSDDKWRHKGSLINKIAKIDNDERVLSIFNYETLNNNRLVFFTRDGLIKCTDGKEYFLDKKSNFQAINFKDENDRVIGVEIKDDDKQIFMVTKQGMSCNLESDVPTQGRRSSGVIGIQLNKGDSVIMARQLNDEGEIVVMTDKGYAKRVIVSFFKISKRNRKGVKIQDLNEKTGNEILFAEYVRMPYDIAYFDAGGVLKFINTEDISIENTVSKGKRIKQIEGTLAKVYEHNITED